MTSANMAKGTRCKNEHVYVSSFVPEHNLPNKQPNALDPFLEPLIEKNVQYQDILQFANNGCILQRNKKNVCS